MKNQRINKYVWKIGLILFEITLVSEIIVTIVFWSFLYNGEYLLKNIDTFNHNIAINRLPYQHVVIYLHPHAIYLLINSHLWNI
mgnify:CR=1 FL=1